MSRHASTTFSDRLKEAQGEEGNEDFARRAGLRLRDVQRYREGKVEPKGASLARICFATGRPAEFFYPGDEEAA